MKLGVVPNVVCGIGNLEYTDSFWKKNFYTIRTCSNNLICFVFDSLFTDQGAVLTHDTEQFIIGQRVWVGGIRPGQIAYIGETHFAPGDWAGVVLDDPSGKLYYDLNWEWIAIP